MESKPRRQFDANDNKAQTSALRLVLAPRELFGGFCNPTEVVNNPPGIPFKT